MRSTRIGDVDVVDFDRLQIGSIFMFSMRDRLEFKKTNGGECIATRQSEEIMDIEKGQLVFVNRE